MKRFIKRARHWIILLLATDAVFVFVTWIIRREAIPYMSLFLFLFTLLILSAGLFAEFHRQRGDENALLQFLEMPDNQTKEALTERFENSLAICTLCDRFLSELARVNEKTVELSEYREYIEAWVHEAKTPLALSTLVLNNHSDEISPYVYTQFNYIQHQLNENVERILFYARLQADHSDITFTHFQLKDCVMEALAEYGPMIEEKHISMTLELEQAAVISDRKIVSFVIYQLLSNAVKYADNEAGKITVRLHSEGDKIYFAIYNNGEGVPPEDAPFIFDKGFTGSYPNRQKATGMGLYLARKYAQKLCAELQLDHRIPYRKGFGIELVFTI